MGSSAPYWLLSAYPLMLTFASLANVVAQQGVLELSDGMSLLQVDFTFKHQSKTPVNSSKWFAWDAWLPALTKAGKSEDITTDFARVWTHLGNQWWTQFVDGQFHKDGPHALDHSFNNNRGGMDGEFYKHSKEEYLSFSDPSLWDLPLTAARIAQINAVHEGGRFSCSNASCLEAYRDGCLFGFDYVYTYADGTREKDVYHGVEGLNMSKRYYDMEGVNMWKQTCSHTIDTWLADYYNSTMGLQGLDRSTRLRKGLPHLAKLFAKFADHQYFWDANSRTRLMVLQIEMVRLGGHPVVLWGLREHVTSQLDQCGTDLCDVTGLLNIILDGWCAWEIVATTGQSPFQSGQYKECYDKSTESCVKNPQPKSPPSSKTQWVEGETGIVVKSP